MHNTHHVERASKIPSGFVAKTSCEGDVGGSRAGEVGADYEAP